MQWWKRLVLIGAVCLLIFFLSFRIVNGLWYRLSVQADLSSANWVGAWESASFPLVSGRIVAKIPDPVPVDQEFTVEAAVYYNLWSPYRTGATKRVKLRGRLAGDDSAGGDNRSSPLVGPPRITFSLKGGAGRSAQIIEYVATTDRQKSTIVGGYRSDGPYDMGQFALVRR